MIKQYHRNGYYLAKKVISPNVINALLTNMRDVFGKITADTSDSGIINLFKNDFSKFYGAANICQWLAGLFRLLTAPEIIDLVHDLGIDFPVVNTRPLVSYSASKLAKNDTYWKVPAHQDWPSTQGSLNGLTLWIPLVSVPKELGALELVSGSHVFGRLDHVDVDGVPVLNNENWDFVSMPMEVGDVLAFSNFLIHRSGINSTENQIRWSAHLRYDDVSESTFIQRNFPHHRTDKRIPGLLYPDFPSKQELVDCFRE